MSRIDAFTTGNLLHYLYHQNYYKLIGIDYQDKKKKVFLNELILQGNHRKMVVQQCFFVSDK